MTYYPIVSRNQRQMDHRPLPDFYMEDFSILGFQVSDCHRAEQILGANSFSLKDSDGSMAVYIETAAGIEDVVQLLKEGGVACEIADVAEGMYQG
ncbi:hypothetical protein DSCW_37090 [Desulfosarcina widdelii]|uniref:Uncharacterized protein n=1 Tax=Desulfosarcina widdelii TaxID=947919 RepID=A0A5K7Z2P2_9BACT|nr:hypothetical protein [Desulfosarcina widdelii]BBO76292.1 hypothetical protein DSCW_37090 [Desulfosarcina widdelii]